MKISWKGLNIQKMKKNVAIKFSVDFRIGYLNLRIDHNRRVYQKYFPFLQTLTQNLLLCTHVKTIYNCTILLLLLSFHSFTNWWFFTGVWVIAVFFQSSGLYTVFKLNLIVFNASRAFETIWKALRIVVITVI